MYYYKQQPFWLIFGADSGAEDDDVVELGDDDENDDDPDDEKEEKGGSAKKPVPKKVAEPAKAYVPPTQEEWDRTKAALAKANSSQRERRQTAIDKAKAEGKSEAEAEALVKAAETAAEKYGPALVRREAKSLLRDAKCKNADRMLQLIDVKKATVTEKDGEFEVIGIEDQVNGLRNEWPEMFNTEEDQEKKTTAEKKPRGLDGGDKKQAAKQPKTATEIAVDRLMGKTS